MDIHKFSYFAIIIILASGSPFKVASVSFSHNPVHLGNYVCLLARIVLDCPYIFVAQAGNQLFSKKPLPFLNWEVVLEV